MPRHCSRAPPPSTPPIPAGTAARRAPRYKEDIFPPWQHGANNDAANRGFKFTVPEVDDLADFHGDITDPKLVLYVGGNYFFAMAPLVAEFEREHPDYKGRLYWETIPPGLLVKQMQAGGTITSGNMTWTAKPDAYFAGFKKVEALVDDGTLAASPPFPTSPTCSRSLVPAGNPAHGHRPCRSRPQGHPPRDAEPRLRGPSCGKSRRRSARPARPALADAVYKAKVADGTTVLTHIHHRQTPLFLMQGLADAGVTWKSRSDLPGARWATRITQCRYPGRP